MKSELEERWRDSDRMSRGLESVNWRERLETKKTERTRELELQF